MSAVTDCSCMLRAGVAGAVMFAIAVPTAPGAIQIHFTGLNLVYDGSAIYDAGSSSGGVADPADADPLTSVDFFVDGGLMGSLASNIALDAFIPDVSGIPSAPNTVHNIMTPGNPGYFDLLIGTSPLASEFLLLDIASVRITFADTSGQVQFLFGGAISGANAQNLPFGLQALEEVSVSFSAQLIHGSMTSSGGIITGFQAAGTGEYSEMPAPGTGLLMALGVPALTCIRRRMN